MTHNGHTISAGRCATVGVETLLLPICPAGGLVVSALTPPIYFDFGSTLVRPAVRRRLALMEKFFERRPKDHH